jgi:carbon starvation protein
VWAGTELDSAFDFPARVWFIAILVYCFIASMLPMWLLQQPRGFLGGFVLYLAIGVGAFGVLFGGFEIKQPFISKDAIELLNPLNVLANDGVPVTAMMVPFLFVTIACGACSGFHGLICGGTTSKQIARETHCKSVAFGAMLLEGFVAVIALATIMILTQDEIGTRVNPSRIYGDGLARFLTLILGPDAFVFCVTFGAMAFSTFVFDTLDVSTRLGRYLLQELFSAPGRVAGAIAAGVTVGVPLVMLLSADERAYLQFWTLFGTSNQLLAALTLLGVTVWLYRNGKRYWYTLAPMCFVMAITVMALGLQIFVGIRDMAQGDWRTPEGKLNPTVVNAPVAIALMLLAIVFIHESVKAARRGRIVPAS